MEADVAGKGWSKTGEKRKMKVGDSIRFLCNGRGRGGHHQVSARVEAISANRITAVEVEGSYAPGTVWRLNKSVEVTILEDQ